MKTASILLALFIAGTTPSERDSRSTYDLPASFVAETIRIVVVGDSIEVEGLYEFVLRPAEVEELPLFYPFPRDSLLGGARMIQLEGRHPGREESREEWEPLRFEALPQRISGVRWWIPLRDLERDGRYEVRGRYRQARKHDYARYIVTTTEAWGRPLRRATFEVTLPPGAVPVGFSYPFTADGDRPQVYVFETGQFFPDHDVTVRWQVRPSTP